MPPSPSPDSPAPFHHFRLRPWISSGPPPSRYIPPPASSLRKVLLPLPLSLLSSPPNPSPLSLQPRLRHPPPLSRSFASHHCHHHHHHDEQQSGTVWDTLEVISRTCRRRDNGELWRRLHKVARREQGRSRRRAAIERPYRSSACHLHRISEKTAPCHCTLIICN